jgi:hypothetical protein
MAAAKPIPAARIPNPPPNAPDTPPRRATRGAFLLGLALMLVAPVTVSAAGVREEHPNLVGGELLGRGIALTLNYERFLNNHFGLGGGVMAVSTGGGTIGIMPVYASYLTGNTHSLYLSAGGALLGGAGSIQEYESTWIMQGSVGYHFQSQGGFFIRPLFTFNQAAFGSNGGFLVWPGITIGGSF